VGFSHTVIGREIPFARDERDLLMGGQDAGGGAAAIDPQLAAGAFDQGVGARLGYPHQGSDFLGQTVLGDQTQGFAFALGKQLNGRGGGRRPVHDTRNQSLASAQRAALSARMHCSQRRPSR
jgi:hypothetical protein